jgi:hypothetical protein
MGSLFFAFWSLDSCCSGNDRHAVLIRPYESTDFASDALLDNDTSHKAHEALGFVEVERAVKYRKAL